MQAMVECQYWKYLKTHTLNNCKQYSECWNTNTVNVGIPIQWMLEYKYSECWNTNTVNNWIPIQWMLEYQYSECWNTNTVNNWIPIQWMCVTSTRYVCDVNLICAWRQPDMFVTPIGSVRDVNQIRLWRQSALRVMSITVSGSICTGGGHKDWL